MDETSRNTLSSLWKIPATKNNLQTNLPSSSQEYIKFPPSIEPVKQRYMKNLQGAPRYENAAATSWEANLCSQKEESKPPAFLPNFLRYSTRNSQNEVPSCGGPAIITPVRVDPSPVPSTSFGKKRLMDSKNDNNKNNTMIESKSITQGIGSKLTEHQEPGKEQEDMIHRDTSRPFSGLEEMRKENAWRKAMLAQVQTDTEKQEKILSRTNSILHGIKIVSADVKGHSSSIDALKTSQNEIQGVIEDVRQKCISNEFHLKKQKNEIESRIDRLELTIRELIIKIDNLSCRGGMPKVKGNVCHLNSDAELDFLHDIYESRNPVPSESDFCSETIPPPSISWNNDKNLIRNAGFEQNMKEYYHNENRMDCENPIDLVEISDSDTDHEEYSSAEDTIQRALLKIRRAQTRMI